MPMKGRVATGATGQAVSGLHCRMTGHAGYEPARRPGTSTGPRVVWLALLVVALLAWLAAHAVIERASGVSGSHHSPIRNGPPRSALATASPRPFDPSGGAPLPVHRIVAVYGIVYGVEGNGYASSLTMLNGYLPQLKELSREYAALDPTHSVEQAVDLVVNPLKPCSEAPKWCSQYPDQATMQAYLRFCQEHHLLLFLDLQLGTEPVRDAVLNHLLPYLEKYPFTELALDTEFHFPNTRGGYAKAEQYPCCLGWMGAGEINWAADELAGISRRYHLPRKVLVVHQWDSSVIHGKEQIRLNPDVSLVVQSDGWGATYDKLNDYTRFVQQSLVEYGGYKLFLPHYGDTQADVPLQTPEQVLQLFPQPLFISYQ